MQGEALQMIGLEAMRQKIRSIHDKLESINVGEWAGDIDDLVTRSYRRVKELTPKQSGVLRESWKWTKERAGKHATYVWIIYNERENDSPGILKFMEYGTKPHKIVPKYKQLLAFRDKGGNLIFAKHVSHPGTRPYAMVAITKSEYAGKIGQVSQKWANQLKALWKSRGL